MRRGSSLLQRQVELARVEMSEKMTQLKMALGEIIGGTVMIAVSLGILLSALVSGLARLLMGFFAEEPTDTAVLLEGLSEADQQIVTAVSQNVTASLDTARTLSTYEGLAALIIGVLFAIIGGLLLRNGLQKLDPENLTPDRSVRQVEKDGDLVRNRV